MSVVVSRFGVGGRVRPIVMQRSSRSDPLSSPAIDARFDASDDSADLAAIGAASGFVSSNDSGSPCR